MEILGIGIAILVLYGQYKSHQTNGKRTAIKVLTIIETVITSIYILYGLLLALALVIVLSMANSAAAYSIDQYHILVIFYAVIFLIYCGLIALACVKGYKALHNSVWTTNAKQFTQTVEAIRNNTFTTAHTPQLQNVV